MGTGERGHEALLDTRFLYGVSGRAKQSEGSGVQIPMVPSFGSQGSSSQYPGGQSGRLKEYRSKRQQFPLRLAMVPQDEDTTTFAALAAKCMEPKSKRQKGKKERIG